ncbi:MAG: hypothetical protein JWR07_1999 [Nevskia sp.]|nr:hypothetical protein [Nevskia sp.]
MRIRQFIVAIMLLLSLSAQARTAFACAMMPGATLAACCCPGEDRDHCPPSSHANHCCELVAPADAPLGHAVVGAHDDQHARIHPIDPPPVAAVESYLLPVSFDAGDKHYLSPQLDASRRRVLPLYLLTARLRL